MEFPETASIAQLRKLYDLEILNQQEENGTAGRHANGEHFDEAENWSTSDEVNLLNCVIGIDDGAKEELDLDEILKMSRVKALSRQPLISAGNTGEVDLNGQIGQNRDTDIVELKDKFERKKKWR